MHTGPVGAQPPARARPRPSASRRGRVDEVLELVGLPSVAGKRAGGFSLGMGQRLGIAAALLGDPQTLMLDEPVNGLDPEGILWIRKLLQDAGRPGPDGLRLRPPDERDGADRRPPHRHRAAAGSSPTCRSTEFIRQSSQQRVRVVSPDAARLRDLLVGPEVAVTSDAPERLEIEGLQARDVGMVAADARTRAPPAGRRRALAGGSVHGIHSRHGGLPRLGIRGAGSDGRAA